MTGLGSLLSCCLVFLICSFRVNERSIGLRVDLGLASPWFGDSWSCTMGPSVWIAKGRTAGVCLRFACRQCLLWGAVVVPTTGLASGPARGASSSLRTIAMLGKCFG